MRLNRSKLYLNSMTDRHLHLLATWQWLASLFCCGLCALHVMDVVVKCTTRRHLLGKAYMLHANDRNKLSSHICCCSRLSCTYIIRNISHHHLLKHTFITACNQLLHNNIIESNSHHLLFHRSRGHPEGMYISISPRS